MPNWCTNKLYVSHEDPGMIEQFKIACALNLFHFFVPRPKIHDNDWYSWNINNWGTKWDVSSEQYELDDEDLPEHIDEEFGIKQMLADREEEEF